MTRVYIVSAKRTAIGKYLGTIKHISPSDLASTVIQNVIAETKIDPSAIDEVIVGNVLMAGQKQGVGRQASINAGIPYEVPAYSLNMICGSGMKAIHNAVSNIKAGDANLIMAGGTESMSGSCFLLPGTIRNGQKMGDMTITDHMICDGLTDAFNNYHMGITAENIAEKYNITRSEQDLFALSSQQKAKAASDGGLFKSEIVPLEVKAGKETTVFDTDEFINHTTTIEKLSKLKPAFKPNGTVTAGNASGLNDGAAFVLLASEEAVKQHNLIPLVEVIAIGQGGVDPAIMGMGPVPAISNVLKKANLKLTNLDIIELNEAFAAQSLGVIKQLCEDHKVTRSWFDKLCNINGGAIALGHPVGASGGRITVSLVHEMKRSNRKYGLASLCIGGGMGTSIIIKNI